MVNPYFNFTQAANEQDLVENLIIESIQIYGMNIQYLPKTLVDYSQLYGEDPQRTFDAAYTIESYFENVDGFMGDKNFLNKMGLNIDKQAVFVVAKRRFDEVLNKLPGNNYWEPRSDYDVDEIQYNTEMIEQNPVRPKEGDLIYLPLTHDIFEILFADHEEVFYQLGKIYVWKITCEKFRFSHEEINTGITAIDDIATQLLNDNSVVNDPLSDNEDIEDTTENFLNRDPKSPF